MKSRVNNKMTTKEPIKLRKGKGRWGTMAGANREGRRTEWDEERRQWRGRRRNDDLDIDIQKQQHWGGAVLLHGNDNEQQSRNDKGGLVERVRRSSGLEKANVKARTRRMSLPQEDERMKTKRLGNDQGNATSGRARGIAYYLPSLEANSGRFTNFKLLEVGGSKQEWEESSEKRRAGRSQRRRPARRLEVKAGT
jgi:hypothetical protein